MLLRPLALGSLVVLLLLACQPRKASDPANDAGDQAVVAPVADAAASATATATATAPVGAAPTYDTSCTNDADCVPAPGCCPVPCTPVVVNQKALPAVQAHNEKTCPKERRCISAGGCRTHAYLCVKKSCALVYSDSPDYHPRQ